MKTPRLAPFVFGCLLAVLPSFLSAGPWDPNRVRPPGFQRTLIYLEKDLYDYPVPELQSVRNTILHEDLVNGLIAQLKSGGYPPANWESLGQQTYDAYVPQYNSLKTVINQTMSAPEGIIRAVEGNQPLPDDLASHPTVKAFIMVRWAMLNIAEQTYQAVLYANGTAPGKSPPTDISPPTKGGKKSNQLDYERMRRDREAASNRRREIEARRAREAAERWEELNKLFRILIGNQAQSSNKFKQAQAGSAATVPQLGEIGPPEPPEQPAPAVTPPEETTKEDPATEPENGQDKQDKPAEKPAAKRVKIKIYQGTFTFTRHPSLGDDQWTQIKAGMIKDMGLTPGVSGLNDAGDVLTWQYKGKVPGDQLLATTPPIFIYTAGETIEEEVTEDGSAPPPAKPKPAFQGNGDLTEENLKGKDVPGSGPQFAPPKADKFSAKPAPKPEPAKPEPAKIAAVPGYWYDPNDNEAKGSDPVIYVRVDGVATRVPLSEAGSYGVPKGASLDTMTWYSEKQGKITKHPELHTNRGN